MATKTTDTLYGNKDNDTLFGGLGRDILDGGLNDDTASYRDAENGLTVSLADASTNTGEAAGDKFKSIENLEGSEFDDLLTGDGSANTISGLGGADTLIGLVGADANFLDGGADRDVVTYANALTQVMASLADSSINSGDAAGDTYKDVEDLEGSQFADTLTGDDNANTLTGLGGNDTIEGLGAADVIYGGRGTDIVRGGAGDDLLRPISGLSLLEGYEGTDTYRLNDWSEPVTIFDSAGEADGLELTDLDFRKMNLERHGDDLVIRRVAGGAAITVTDQFAAGGKNRLEWFEFTDRTIEAVEIERHLESQFPNAAKANTLHHTAFSVGQDLNGWGGGDVYVYRHGIGEMKVRQFSSAKGSSTLRLENVTLDQLTWERPSTPLQADFDTLPKRYQEIILARRRPKWATCRDVLSNGFGFGGVNACVVFGRV